MKAPCFLKLLVKNVLHKIKRGNESFTKLQRELSKIPILKSVWNDLAILQVHCPSRTYFLTLVVLKIRAISWRGEGCNTRITSRFASENMIRREFISGYVIGLYCACVNLNNHKDNEGMQLLNLMISGSINLSNNLSIVPPARRSPY